MKVDSKVKVLGTEIRHAGWQCGYSAGSPVRFWSVTALEPGREFEPGEVDEPTPVDVTLELEGFPFDMVKDGHLEGVDEQVTARGIEQSLSGRDSTEKLLEEGPLSDTIFVPRNLVEEIYPRGVKVRLLSGETVIGVPPNLQQGAGGSASRAPGSVIGSQGEWANAPGVGPVIVARAYPMVDEQSFLAPDPDGCPVDNRFGPPSEYIEALPPTIVIFGPSTGTLGSYRLTSPATSTGSSGSGASKLGPDDVAGGSSVASTRALIQLLAFKAGFTEVENSCPDMGIFEPLTVSAGSRWFDAIGPIVAPWNPTVFADGTTLYILDIEAAKTDKPVLTFGPSSATVIGRRKSRNPPYKSIDVIGALRHVVKACYQIPPGTEVTGVNAPAGGGAGRGPLGDLDSAESKLSFGGGSAGCATATIRKLGDGPFERGPRVEAPYNLIVVQTFTPRSSGSSRIPGPDALDWQRIELERRFYVDPGAGQVVLRSSDERVYDLTGLRSRSVFEVRQGVFDPGPSSMLREQYERVRLPGMQTDSVELIRRETTTYGDSSELDGTVSEHVQVDGLLVSTLADDGTRYKTLPYWEAAGAGTIDMTPSSRDAPYFGRFSETHTDYQTIDRHVGQKTVWTCYDLGDRTPEFDISVFFLRDPFTGDAPRQRECFPANTRNGRRTQSIASLYAATKAQMKLIADRAKRRSTERHVELDVEVTSPIPKLRPGIAVGLEAVPLRVTHRTTGIVSTVPKVSGNFFLKGFTNWARVDQGSGAVRSGTRLTLTSRY